MNPIRVFRDTQWEDSLLAISKFMASTKYSIQ